MMWIAKTVCWLRGHRRTWQADPVRPKKLWGVCGRCGDRIAGLHPSIAESFKPLAKSHPALTAFIEAHTVSDKETYKL
jgi:hypothetical protein